MPPEFAVGQQLGLAEKLQSAKVAMVVDPLLVQLEVAVQLVLQLELFAALVADVETTVLEVHMVVQEDPARKMVLLINERLW